MPTNNAADQTADQTQPQGEPQAQPAQTETGKKSRYFLKGAFFKAAKIGTAVGVLAAGAGALTQYFMGHAGTDIAMSALGTYGATFGPSLITSYLYEAGAFKPGPRR